MWMCSGLLLPACISMGPGWRVSCAGFPRSAQGFGKGRGMWVGRKSDGAFHGRGCAGGGSDCGQAEGAGSGTQTWQLCWIQSFSLGSQEQLLAMPVCRDIGHLSSLSRPIEAAVSPSPQSCSSRPVICAVFSGG